MDSTYVSVPPELKPRLATGHLDDGNRHPGMILQVIIPAGGLHSSANDMLKYVSANIGLQPNPLTPLMQKTHPIRHPESNDPVGGPRGATAMPWYDDRPTKLRIWISAAMAAGQPAPRLSSVSTSSVAAASSYFPTQLRIVRHPLVAHPSKCLVETHRHCHRHAHHGDRGDRNGNRDR